MLSSDPLLYKILCYQAIRNCIKSYAIVRPDFGGLCADVSVLHSLCSCVQCVHCECVLLVWCLTALNSCHHCEQ